MEGFEHLVKVALELDRLIVSSNVKFPIKMKTRREGGLENQTHGYEIDLVGARQDLLVLASVKSFFGSGGVSKNGFRKFADHRPGEETPRQRVHYNLYRLFNDRPLRSKIIKSAAKRYGYSPDDVELRLYVGHFRSDDHRDDITKHLASVKAGRGPIKVVSLPDLLSTVFRTLETKTYVNDPVVSTLKALVEAATGVRDDNGRRRGRETAIQSLRQVLGIDG